MERLSVSARSIIVAPRYINSFIGTIPISFKNAKGFPIPRNLRFLARKIKESLKTLVDGDNTADIDTVENSTNKNQWV